MVVSDTSFIQMDEAPKSVIQHLQLPHLEMVYVQGGTFTLGSNEVTLSDFELGKYPVTQALWDFVFGRLVNPSRFPNPRSPVERVSWYDAISYCNWLNKKLELPCCYFSDEACTKVYGVVYHEDREFERMPNRGQVYFKPTPGAFRLPTEAEWAYAARGGVYHTKMKYAGSDRLKDVGWYDNKSEKGTQCIALLQPNALGLYDLSGNVEEWCWDLYGLYPRKDRTNPTGPTQSKSGRRITRGGSQAYTDPKQLTLDERGSRGPYYREGNFGFRLARHLTL